MEVIKNEAIGVERSIASSFPMPQNWLSAVIAVISIFAQ